LARLSGQGTNATGDLPGYFAQAVLEID